MSSISFDMYGLTIALIALFVTIGTSFHAKLLHRIVGGQLTTIERFPYQALLQSNHYFCGGAILTKTVILTAAHCATGPPRNLIVFVGITYLSERKTSYRYRVEHYFIHDQYLGKATPEYDVAILRLSTSLVFSSKIQSIALPTRAYEEGQQVVATGWGQTELKPSSNQLKYINLTIGESPKCKPRIGAICTFDETKSVCKGDSGGPLVSNNVLIGIVSSGKGKNNCYGYEYYADVFSLIPFIRLYTG